jgi:atypical dual specificity phosphatase
VSDWFERYGYGRIDAQLLTGSLPTDAGDVAALREEGVTAVVNLCSESEYEPGERAAVVAAYADAGISERRFETEDYGNLMPGLLERASGAALELMQDGDVVYLHCRAGWQRSAAVAAATIARRDGIEPDAALGVIKRGRMSAQPLGHQLEDLWRWWRARSARAESASSEG